VVGDARLSCGSRAPIKRTFLRRNSQGIQLAMTCQEGTSRKLLHPYDARLIREGDMRRRVFIAALGPVRR
jgi:hypothetical protein